MTLNIHPSWNKYLHNEFKKPYFKSLSNYVLDEYKNHQCFPPIDEVFTALNRCSFDNLKVVIIGQDPYHGLNQANGLCFSVNDEIAHPPSLKNIFKEIESDLGIPSPLSGNLERWADQGVLLLNATLTVRGNLAGSHQNKGWEIFTNAVIASISEHKKDVIFLLWGGFAKKKINLINSQKHQVLTSGHPSPLSANRGYWFGNKHFSKTNSLLQQASLEPIIW
ncbi:MAG: uracil-DNA glycosylase [Flavobacteriaceae bacterium]|nr:uracil-DNA glycosylase [Flavobacteriaceae bacterium]